MWRREDGGASREKVFMSTVKTWKTLTLTIKNNIGFLTVNRANKLNALNQEVLDELRDILDHLLRQEISVNALVLTGAGEKAFIAGADIKSMAKMSSKEALSFGKQGQEITLLLEQLPIPVIACVNGLALGGGMEMAMACDFILASKNAIFGQPEVKLGLIPGFGGTQRLTRLVGRGRAKEIIYTGRNITAKEALQIGIVLNVLPNKKDLLKEAEKIIVSILKNSSRAIALAKGAINEGSNLPLPQGLECELECFSGVFGSPDMLEGTTAFLEKRPPRFKGR